MRADEKCRTGLDDRKAPVITIGKNEYNWKFEDIYNELKNESLVPNIASRYK